MTKEEAIKHLHTYSSTNGSGQTTQEQHEEAKRMAIKALEAPQWIPAKTTADGWTIIDDRIHLKKSILITYETVTGRRYVKQVEVGALGVRGYVAKQIAGKIVAWMPLPDIYREEN